LFLGLSEDAQAEFERKVRQKLLEEIEEHGLRRAAHFLGVDTSNLQKWFQVIESAQ
jgi:hypothetical protein